MKRDCCRTWLLNVKIAFGLFFLLCVSVCVFVLEPKSNRCQSCCGSSLSLSRGSPSYPPGFLSKWSVKHTHTPEQMFAKGHLPSSFCISTTPRRWEQKTNSREKTLLNPQISLLGIECRTFKIIRLKWIESAGLSPHEQAAEIQWWGGMIMRPLTVLKHRELNAEI